MGDRSTDTASPGALDPGAPAIDGFRSVLAHLAGAIADNWQGTIDRTDPEFLHDLRVATRRTRSVLTNGKGVIPDPVRDAAREGFGRFSDLTGRPRDLDVYLLGWDTYTAPLGADVAGHLEPVRTLLERDRHQAYDRLVEAMQAPEAHVELDTWNTWLRDPVEGPLPGRARKPLGKIVAKRIAAAQDTVLREGRVITAESPAEALHRLRKDAKKLRYLLECFGSVLAPKPRVKLVKRLKALQENLGEHQDAAVHLDELRSIARQLHDSASADTMLAIGQLMGELVHVQRTTRDEFAERFTSYDTPATGRALDAALRWNRS